MTDLDPALIRDLVRANVPDDLVARVQALRDQLVDRRGTKVVRSKADVAARFRAFIEGASDKRGERGAALSPVWREVQHAVDAAIREHKAVPGSKQGWNKSALAELLLTQFEGQSGAGRSQMWDNLDAMIAISIARLRESGISGISGI